jgi:hypothetical protein
LSDKSGGSRRSKTEGKRGDERQSEVSWQLARDAGPVSKTRLTGVSGKNGERKRLRDEETKRLRAGVRRGGRRQREAAAANEGKRKDEEAEGARGRAFLFVGEAGEWSHGDSNPRPPQCHWRKFPYISANVLVINGQKVLTTSEIDPFSVLEGNFWHR